MSHPPSEPDRERRQRVTPEPVSRVDLFSHTADPEMYAQHRLPADGGDWQAVPFSGGAAGSAEPRRPVALDEQDT
jgi:hypothetical protein